MALIRSIRFLSKFQKKKLKIRTRIIKSGIKLIKHRIERIKDRIKIIISPIEHIQCVVEHSIKQTKSFVNDARASIGKSINSENREGILRPQLRHFNR